MDSTLLATKLHIPPLRRDLLNRARLIDALEQQIPDYKLILISAPAGYGKTTLVAQWARDSQYSIAWLSLSREENDPARFLRYLVAAWDEAQPGIKETTVGLLLGMMDSDLEAVLAAFINVVARLTEHTVFVLDDFQVIDEPGIHQALTFLLDNLPPTVHFVITTRGEPPLPVARYRARHELLDVGIKDLSFLFEETGEFLRGQLGFDVAPDDLTLLQKQLEGWVAGLQLVSHTLRRHPKSLSNLAVSGRHRYIADFLKEDVLANLPDDTRQFLLQTSILDGLCGQLCNVVTARADSQQVLEMLEREGIFLAALDDSRTWFRYHPLFAGVLRDELARNHSHEMFDLHRRVARWWLDQGMPEQAFEYAIAGQDVHTVIQIGDDYAVIKMETGESNVIRHWIDSIPPEWFTHFPPLLLMQVVTSIYSGDIPESMHLLDIIESQARSTQNEDSHKSLGKVATARCAIACFMNDLPLAEQYAAEALRELPADERFFRSSIHHALGDTYSRNAHWEQAKASLLQSLSIVHGPSYPVRSVHIFGALADLELRQGHLGAAEAYWNKALTGIQNPELWGRLPIPVTGWVSIRKAELLYERNSLEDAKSHLDHGLELARLGGDVRSLLAGYLLAARLELAAGSPALAAGHLELASPLCDHAQFPEWLRRVDRCRLEVWMAQDQLRAAVNWADALPPDGVRDSFAETEIDQLSLVRLLIIKGHQVDRDRALSILSDLIDQAHANGRMGILIEALSLQAMAHWESSDRLGALTSLERALTLAEPEGYLRLFVDLGPRLAPILYEAVARQVMAGYARRILAAFESNVLPGDNGVRTLSEPLSDREREVLGLIAAGLTNREIGDKLFISAETVKKHTGSIYAKLQVGHRTEAVARARKLGILDGR